MAIILKANKINLFVSSVLFVFWYHSPNFLDTPRITIDVLNGHLCTSFFRDQFTYSQAVPISTNTYITVQSSNIPHFASPHKAEHPQSTKDKTNSN
jgi:hypothetical protein